MVSEDDGPSDAPLRNILRALFLVLHLGVITLQMVPAENLRSYTHHPLNAASLCCLLLAVHQGWEVVAKVPTPVVYKEAEAPHPTAVSLI